MFVRKNWTKHILMYAKFIGQLVKVIRGDTLFHLTAILLRQLFNSI